LIRQPGIDWDHATEMEVRDMASAAAITKGFFMDLSVPPKIPALGSSERPFAIIPVAPESAKSSLQAGHVGLKRWSRWSSVIRAIPVLMIPRHPISADPALERAQRPLGPGSPQIESWLGAATAAAVTGFESPPRPIGPDRGDELRVRKLQLCLSVRSGECRDGFTGHRDKARPIE
jgi:hypothetical protein